MLILLQEEEGEEEDVEGATKVGPRAGEKALERMGRVKTRKNLMVDYDCWYYLLFPVAMHC